MSGQDDAGQWPSRKEWVQTRRALYEEQYPDISHILSYYANAEEIAALKRALIARRRTYEAGTDKRDGVNRAILLIAENKLPVLLQDYLGADDIFAAMHGRYNAAREEIAASIEDAAWAKELVSRVEVEAYLASVDAARAARSSAEPPGGTSGSTLIAESPDEVIGRSPSRASASRISGKRWVWSLPGRLYSLTRLAFLRAMTRTVMLDLV